ncbi:hypothetical protein AB0B28_08075 [Glycomyces sp. NPDC046736]
MTTTITAEDLRDLMAADNDRESGDAYRLTLAIGPNGRPDHHRPRRRQ